MSNRFCSCTPTAAIDQQRISGAQPLTISAGNAGAFLESVRMRSSIQHPTTPFPIAFLSESVFAFVSMHSYVDSSLPSSL